MKRIIFLIFLIFTCFACNFDYNDLNDKGQIEPEENQYEYIEYNIAGEWIIVDGEFYICDGEKYYEYDMFDYNHNSTILGLYDEYSQYKINYVVKDQTKWIFGNNDGKTIDLICDNEIWEDGLFIDRYHIDSKWGGIKIFKDSTPLILHIVEAYKINEQLFIIIQWGGGGRNPSQTDYTWRLKMKQIKEYEQQEKI